MVKKAEKSADVETIALVRITPPNLRRVMVSITGTAPLMTARLSAKTRDGLLGKMVNPDTPGSRKKREARVPEQEVEAALHRAGEGWAGFPASAIRSGMISACRVAGFKMTLAKLSCFVPAQGYDVVDGLPLIEIKGDYESNIMHVRNATGVIDIRVRPIWREWAADFQIEFDADQFSASDIFNLLQRVGAQVGIGEGRPDSRDSAGIGFGTFKVEIATE
jgi:hypothetical protein